MASTAVIPFPPLPDNLLQGRHIDGLPPHVTALGLGDGNALPLALRTWDELTREEIGVKLAQSEADIAAGCVYTQEELDSKIRKRFANGGKAPFQ